MELNREKKFACKFCNKRYPCGKSLGGHIRTHMNNENLAETEEDSAEIPIKNLISSKRFVESANYGLRENPKKTKRFSDSGKGSSSLKEMMICKECGKGFGSLKALCGHMSCHSEKHELVMDSQSDTETSTPSKRRSKRVKYKTVNNSDNMGNGSSSVSEIVQEQEEVALAMCLMMLSRDTSGCKKWPSLNSVADSSDNNSVVLEDKSSSIDVRITIKNNNKLKKKRVEYDSPSENSDSGYFRNGPKKVESDESVDAFLKSIDFRRRYECLTCNKTFDSHRALGGHRASHTKVNDCNESMHDESCENSLANDSFTAPMTDTKVTKSCSNGKSLRISKGSSSKAEKRSGSKKTKGHECPFCFRVFKSGQALGGHKRSHFVGGSDNRTFVIKQDMQALIDLNLPAPGFMPW